MGYMKKNEFFEMEIDAAKYEGQEYHLKRISSKAMEFEMEGLKKLQYVNTVVATIDSENGTIQLNSNGWKSQTTKKHINNMIINYGYKLFQKNFEWYVEKCSGEVIDFEDGMILKI